MISFLIVWESIPYIPEADVQGRRIAHGPPDRGLSEENFNLVLPVFGFCPLACTVNIVIFFPQVEWRSRENKDAEFRIFSRRRITRDRPSSSTDKHAAAIMHPVSLAILDASIAGTILPPAFYFPDRIYPISRLVTDDNNTTRIDARRRHASLYVASDQPARRIERENTGHAAV